MKIRNVYTDGKQNVYCISKFKSIPKTLVTKDCKIGKKLMKTLIDMGIEVSII